MKHHRSNKRKRHASATNKKGKDAPPPEDPNKDLDRFAGSSDDEDDDASDERPPRKAAATNDEKKTIRRGRAIKTGQDAGERKGGRAAHESVDDSDEEGRGDHEAARVDADPFPSNDDDSGSSDEDEKPDRAIGSKQHKKLGIFHATKKNSKLSKNSESESESNQSDDDQGDNDGGDDEDDESASDDDNDVNSDSDADSLEEAQAMEASSGMADAMSRILGGGAAAPISREVPSAAASQPKAAAAPGSIPTPVLSKTKTPLQRQAEQERNQKKELLEKRKQNRDKHLQALHIPLGGSSRRAASSGVVADPAAVAREVEQERMLKRVATKGVVALFNAIAQHQKGPASDGTTKAPTGKGANQTGGKGSVSQLSKEGFLSLIKSKASQTKQDKKSSSLLHGGAASSSSKAATSDGGGKWNALSDEYMMDSKKNWDPDEDEEEEEVSAAE